jgi:hypothetical protein
MTTPRYSGARWANAWQNLTRSSKSSDAIANTRPKSMTPY